MILAPWGLVTCLAACRAINQLAAISAVWSISQLLFDQ